MSDCHLVLSDSELASATCDAHTLRLRFAVMQVVSAPHPPAQPQGYISGVTLVLHDAVVKHIDGPLIGRISRGEVICNGQPIASLSLQDRWAGTLIVNLQGSGRFQFEAQGSALTITTDGPVQVRESYAC